MLLIELISELLELHFILIAHLMGLDHTFLTNFADLAAKDVTKLLHTDASQRRGGLIQHSRALRRGLKVTRVAATLSCLAIHLVLN